MSEGTLFREKMLTVWKEGVFRRLRRALGQLQVPWDEGLRWNLPPLEGDAGKQSGVGRKLQSHRATGPLREEVEDLGRFLMTP